MAAVISKVSVLIPGFNLIIPKSSMQGRIQDLKLGVALMDWKVLTGGGGDFGYFTNITNIKNTIIIVYIYIYLKYYIFQIHILYNILHLKPPSEILY